MRVLSVIAIGVFALQCASATAEQLPRLELAQQEISDSDFNRYIAKSNGVVELLNASLRAKESWHRYLSWANAQSGPTGKEKVIYGLYSVPPSARNAIEKARKTASDAPSIPVLDQAVRELASSFETVIPILNKASDYYHRKDYLSDDMAGGKALHQELTPAVTAFLTARAKTEGLENQLKDLIDRQQLSKIEKAEGKSLNWHTRHTMILAKQALDLLPTSPKPGDDFRAFDAALSAFGDAVRDFDAAVRESGKSTSIDSFPRDILGDMRELRNAIAKAPAHAEEALSMRYQKIIANYNMMVNMSNAFR